MKQEFSNAWNSSTQTRKQRKYRANAPLHIKGDFLSGHLSKELRKKYGTRSIRIRKGDDVKIMLGKFKGKSGKVTEVNTKKQKVTIDGMQNKKKDGTKINAFFNTSNLIITQLNVDDKKRFKRSKVKIEKKKETSKKEKLKKIVGEKK
jgi:large subunit ribosomal protein L24